jgi:hypothetical protein
MTELLRLPHYVVTVDDDARLVRRVRTEERFSSIDELVSTYETLLSALDAIDRPRFAQLIDARLSPPRNDPAFEEVVSRYHDRLYRGFRRVAVLVRSAAGRLQVRRMLDSSGIEAPVFSDEDEALEYLADEA